MARTRQSVLEPKAACSYGLVVVTISSSPWTFVVFVVTAVNWLASFACKTKYSRWDQCSCRSAQSRIKICFESNRYRETQLQYPSLSNSKKCKSFLELWQLCDKKWIATNLLLNFRDLLPLLRRRGNLSTENDVPYFWLCQCWSIHIVLLSIIRQNQISQCNFHLHPLIIIEVWPDMVRLCDNCLVRLQQHLCFLIIDMESTQNEDESRKCSIWWNGLQPVIVDVEKNHLWLCCL